MSEICKLKSLEPNHNKHAPDVQPTRNTSQTPNQSTSAKKTAHTRSKQTKTLKHTLLSGAPAVTEVSPTPGASGASASGSGTGHVSPRLHKARACTTPEGRTAGMRCECFHLLDCRRHRLRQYPINCTENTDDAWGHCQILKRHFAGRNGTRRDAWWFLCAGCFAPVCWQQPTLCQKPASRSRRAATENRTGPMEKATIGLYLVALLRKRASDQGGANGSER
eukprot:3207465-Rhodomonas_salina.1